MAREAILGSPKFGKRRGEASASSAKLSSPPGAKGQFPVYDSPAAQLILREFESCAVVLAIVLSVINRHKPKKVVPFSLREFQPPHPTHFLALRSQFDDIGLVGDIVGALERFYRCYATAFDAIVEITSDMPNGFDHSWVISASRDLNRAADAARDAIQHFDPEPLNGLEVRPTSPAPAPQLRKLLEDACAGRTPCWVNGRPALPTWHRLRYSKRNPLNFRATLVHDHGSAKVMVVDISRDGLGMRPSPECAIGSRVSIDFEFGRSLRGTITRKDANGAGMIFASPLVFRL